MTLKTQKKSKKPFGKQGEIFTKLKAKVPAKIEKGDKIISYSQFATYRTCPRKWYLSKIKKHRRYEPSIHLVFGNAMHETIQEWLKVVYNDTVKKSNEMDLPQMLLTKMKQFYMDSVTNENNGEHFSTKQQLQEYYNHGVKILNYLKKKRTLYFTTKRIKLVGIEVPIILPVDEDKGKIKFMAYIDVVLYDDRDKTYTLIDLKTSKRGWGKYQKKDFIKLSQLLFYKKLFSKQYGIDIDKIKVEFMVFRNEIDEDSLYPPPRIQEVKPAQKSVSLNKAFRLLQEWIDMAFDENGYVDREELYPAVTGDNYFNCAFCPYRDDETLCPAAKRITNHEFKYNV